MLFVVFVVCWLLLLFCRVVVSCVCFLLCVVCVCLCGVVELPLCFMLLFVFDA